MDNILDDLNLIEDDDDWESPDYTPIAQEDKDFSEDVKNLLLSCIFLCNVHSAQQRGHGDNQYLQGLWRKRKFE